MAPPQTEDIAARKAVAGSMDAQAFAGVVETYQVAVFNLCYRMLGDPDQAEEAAQETFLRAFRSLTRYDPSRPLRTWMLSIAAHYCIDLVRRRSLIAFLPFGPREIAHADPGPEASLIRKEAVDEVGRMLHALNPGERAAVILTYWYDLSQAEIAETTGSTVDAVRTRLHRARRLPSIAGGVRVQRTGHRSASARHRARDLPDALGYGRIQPAARHRLVDLALAAHGRAGGPHRHVLAGADRPRGSNGHLPARSV